VFEAIASNGTPADAAAKWITPTTSVQAVVVVHIGFKRKQALTASNFEHWMTVCDIEC